MIKEFIGTGKTVESAMQAAKLGLNAPLDADIKIEVIAHPKKKILGLFGGSDAQVKVSYDDGVKEHSPKKKAPKKNNAPKKDAKKEAKKPAPKKDTAPKKEEAKDYPESVDLELAKSYLADILAGLKVENPTVNATYDKGVITMELDAEDYAIVIGRRGETLDSIQYLLSLIMKKHSNGYVRVTINVGNYREKRNETLRNLAKKNADYVLRTGRKHTFEPMNPYERRIIHTTIQEIEGVESMSIGYNQDRRVVITPVGGAKPRNNGGNRRGGARRPAQAKTDAPAREKKVDRADLPKFGKIEVPNKD